MSKKIKNIILFLILIFSICAAVKYARAASDDGTLGKDIEGFTAQVGGPYNSGAVGMESGKSIMDVYQLLIGRFAAFLSIIFFAQVIIGGFQLMTAGGNEEKVGEAKKRIMHGVIGVGIVLSAYIITYFALSQISKVSGVRTGFE